jgi:hypothetical protein
MLKRDYPSWSHIPITNYWWSRDINEGPDNIGFSLAYNPYLPPSVDFRGRFAHDYQVPAQVPNPVPNHAPVEVQVRIGINKDLLKMKMTSSPHLLCRRHQCQQAQAQLKSQHHLAEEYQQ